MWWPSSEEHPSPQQVENEVINRGQSSSTRHSSSLPELLSTALSCDEKEPALNVNVMKTTNTEDADVTPSTADVTDVISHDLTMTRVFKKKPSTSDVHCFT